MHYCTLNTSVSTAIVPHHAYAAQYTACSAFIKWMSCYTPAKRHIRLQAIAQRPSLQLQLVYLAALGDDPGSSPANMAEALERIDAALQRGEVAS